MKPHIDTGEVTEEQMQEEYQEDLVGHNQVIDQAVWFGYLQLPKEMRDNLPFKDYWIFYRVRIDRKERELDQEEADSIIDAMAPKEEDMCIVCKDDLKMAPHLDYCHKCERNLQEEADQQALKIKEELTTDPVLNQVKSETQFVAYVKDKYKQVVSNKRVPLTQIAKELYSLMKLRKG